MTSEPLSSVIKSWEEGWKRCPTQLQRSASKLEQKLPDITENASVGLMLFVLRALITFHTCTESCNFDDTVWLNWITFKLFHLMQNRGVLTSATFPLSMHLKLCQKPLRGLVYQTCKSEHTKTTQDTLWGIQLAVEALWELQYPGQPFLAVPLQSHPWTLRRGQSAQGFL